MAEGVNVALPVNVAPPVNVAVVGATGLVGEAVLAALTEREFPIGELFALGRDDVDGETVLFADRPKRLKPLAGFDFSRCRFAFFCTPTEVSAAHARRAAAAGCTVIDLSGQFRLDAGVPLVAADANAASATAGLIASPSAEVVQLAAVLAPLQAAVGLRRVHVTTLLSVSDRGRAGVAELAGQTARLLNVQGIEPKAFPAQIAFNVLRQGDAPDVGAELRKVLGNPELVVESGSFHVPVFYGHSQSLRVETDQPIAVEQARKLLRKAAGIKLSDRGAAPSPVGDGTGEDRVLVGRIEALSDGGNGLLLWTLADNVRKGAAVNSVQIAETLLKAHP
ncbi:MAG: aspartate-semialdehyde dehydrogenase [Ectothiorhodospiraceae bacterium]|jgi:aspartate-semialdehyde dehydrogenase|nr:aspartate-semialdehyde dehydrogenase [Ectothiorhodospiraceae bacterium]